MKRWTRYSIYNTLTSFNAREREDLSSLNYWREEPANLKALFAETNKFEIVVKKYEPEPNKTFYLISVGEVFSSGNPMLIYHKHFFDFSHFIEEVRDSVRAITAGYHYKDIEKEFPLLDSYNK